MSPQFGAVFFFTLLVIYWQILITWFSLYGNNTLSQVCLINGVFSICHLICVDKTTVILYKHRKEHRKSNIQNTNSIFLGIFHPCIHVYEFWGAAPYLSKTEMQCFVVNYILIWSHFKRMFQFMQFLTFYKLISLDTIFMINLSWIIEHRIQKK